MKKLRFNLTVKLMLFASFIMAIPFIGYYYIDGMEELLRKGQEQNLMGNARGLATALHERPKLFNQHANYKKTLETGKDFFPTIINHAIALDGDIADWKDFITPNNTNNYNAQNQVKKHNQNSFQLYKEQDVSLSFQTHIGQYKDYVYAFFEVFDDDVIFRKTNQRQITHNDHLELATINENNQLVRYVVSNFKQGWLNAYLMPSDINGLVFPAPENRIQGILKQTQNGYNIELRIPKKLVGERFGFHISDIDKTDTSKIVNIGTTSTEKTADLGTFTVPSEQIERIIEASKRSHSSIRVIDIHHRELLSKGNLINATGEWINSDISKEEETFLNQLKNWILEPFYMLYLVKPAATFITEDFTNRKSQPHISNALKGVPDSHWWKSKDNKAVILSAAYPIYLEGKVEGVIIVEETTHGIRNIRNKAVEGIIITSLLIALSVIMLFSFSLWTSLKIRKLRNQIDDAVDENGRLTNNLIPFNSNDEIGDVSRSMSTLVKQLGEYNEYLQTMSSRLSHELKTPISVVRSSIEMLQHQNLPEDSQRYMTRAMEGINRLNSMLMAMSEATHLEQALQTSDFEEFNLAALIDGCVQSYCQVYKPQPFELSLMESSVMINGSDEHIMQLFDKLISNAVEFSEQNSPIRVTLQLTADQKGAIVSIENKGPLLPKNMQDKIFEPMVSIRNSTKHNQPHLGIGLYICRLITQFHKGEIKAENLDNSDGVKFSLVLPLS